MNHLHFVTVPLDELGNFLPEILNQWYCLDHNCGYDQAVFSSPDIQSNIASIGQALNGFNINLS